MLLDHTGMILFPDVLWLRILGRVALPLYALCIAEGFRHTRSRGKYFLRIFILGVLCQIVYDFVSTDVYLGILITFSLSIVLLTLIDALIQSGEIDAASRYMEAVEDAFVEHPLYQIEGVLLASALKREAAEPDYDGAISLGQSALKLLKTLGEANLTADVIAAGKALEMRANLAVALAVARKSWKNPSDQEKAFEWLEAADEIAKELDAARGEKSELASARLEVWRTGLEVGLEMPDATQLDQYARDLRSTVDKYLAKTLDEVSAASARWIAGQALANAAKIFEARKDYQQAIISGRKALEYLEVALQFRPEADRAIVGVLNARIGADFLNGLKNAKEASTHLAKADALFQKIEGEVKPKDAAEIGTQLAAVGAIYWKSGKKDEGVATLKRSVAVLARAVEAGVVDKTALYVPYANLATMSKAMKNAADAAKYAKLAEACAPKK
jgi:tetratricopeptide (TPR) repeat protein